MSEAKKKVLKEHRDKAQQYYNLAVQELGDAHDNFLAAEQRRRDAQTAHAKADTLVKMADGLCNFFYPEEPEPAPPESEDSSE